MSRWTFDPAEVAAGAIDDDQHAAVADALRSDPAFAAEVAAYQRVVEHLEALPGVAWDPVPPPPIDVRSITASAPPVATTTRMRARRPARWMTLAAAAAVVLVVAVAIIRPWDASEQVSSEQTVQLDALSGEPTDVQATVTLPGDDGGEVRVRVSGAEPTPEGYVEELWLMNSATDLVSLGTFRVGADGTADATFTTAAAPSAFVYVDTSREPEDGNPAHSGDSVLRSAPLH